MKISNEKWCWWSCGVSGRSELDYLIHVCYKSLPGAVLQINGLTAVLLPHDPAPLSWPVKLKRLLSPEKNDTNSRVVTYLAKRGMPCI